ncbi:putative metalloprotease CJM1_0395 family protein [Ferrovibrio terrae]|uniref:putative metalloprotease CJM1_0395 family protein n=1 Tax=Ferrovibrio terrae TaxID=2594003 RepID=UPI00313844D9
MIGSLSLFSPGTIQGYGSSTATPQSLANDGSAVCASLDCGEHGALNRATLQAQFPGLSLSAASAAQQQQAQQQQSQQPQGQQQTGFAPRRNSGSASASGGAVATGGGRLAGATLLTAQEAGQSGRSDAAASGELSEEEQAQVAKLKQIDAKVRAHERAHAAAGGAHAGAPSYSYTRGPDGQMYATSGEVAIDLSAENDPEATLQKATQVAAAALAPADPSGQDRAVAAAAAQLRLQALAQIREEKRAEREQQEAEAGEADAATAQTTGQAGPATPADPAGQARITAANRRIGQLVGLIA